MVEKFSNYVQIFCFSHDVKIFPQCSTLFCDVLMFKFIKHCSVFFLWCTIYIFPQSFFGHECFRQLLFLLFMTLYFSSISDVPISSKYLIKKKLLHTCMFKKILPWLVKDLFYFVRLYFLKAFWLGLVFSVMWVISFPRRLILSLYAV